jgi:formate hydrogenlyase subunit 3/multisubunit Na+/H+ antiporter MnhD subunit
MNERTEIIMILHTSMLPLFAKHIDSIIEVKKKMSAKMWKTLRVCLVVLLPPAFVVKKFKANQRAKSMRDFHQTQLLFSSVISQ